MGLEKVQDLRYGENPQQTAAFYVDPFATGVAVSRTKQLHGKELSYNNILDLESALELLREFETAPTPSSSSTPIPAASHPVTASRKRSSIAYNVDPLAAFGCVIGLNREVDLGHGRGDTPHFVDCVIAPEYSSLTRWSYAEKKKNIRLLRPTPPITLDERAGAEDEAHQGRSAGPDH